MGDRTKIDWCDASWNPVTGCLHGCEYCYAWTMANRFKMNQKTGNGSASAVHEDETLNIYRSSRTGDALVELEEPITSPVVRVTGALKADKNAFHRSEFERTEPYPCGFAPTFHRYRLDIPAQWKRPRNIFVCSMADLFGEWVEDRWISEVLDACRKAPWHRYLFLTKNPGRFDELEEKGIITDRDFNFWLGSTTTDVMQDLLHYNRALHTFQSCEPMLAPWPSAGKPNQKHLENGELPEWVIFGAETGNRKGKVVPEKAWIDNAVQMCRNIGAKVFMKESLREIMGEDFIQEFPWQ